MKRHFYSTALNGRIYREKILTVNEKYYIADQGIREAVFGGTWKDINLILEKNETIQREFGMYDTVRDNYPKYVVSMDRFDMSRNGIKNRNVREFLMKKE